jgi:NADH-quinone oxidoreductase subunit M
MIYDRAHTRDMDELSGMSKVLPVTVVAFTIGGLVSMGMPGLSGFVAEFPIFLGLWQGGELFLESTFLGLNPSIYYPILAIISVFGIVFTAAYVMRAIGNVFFGKYEGEKWHDMRPLLAIDKLALIGFVSILIILGMFPNLIAPIIASGVAPVVNRIQETDPAFTVFDTLQSVATNIVSWLGGA